VLPARIRAVKLYNAGDKNHPDYEQAAAFFKDRAFVPPRTG
jgi:hypothetical protein